MEKPFANSMTTIRYEKSILGVVMIDHYLMSKHLPSRKWSKGLGMEQVLN